MAKYFSEAGLSHLWTNILKPLFATKVDKVSGKGLSTLDFSQTHVDRLVAVENAATTLNSVKVDKSGTKVLSTNDFTTAYKDQIDQNVVDIAALDAAKVDVAEGKGLSTNDFTTAYKNQINDLKNVLGAGMIVKFGIVSVTTSGGTPNRATAAVTFDTPFGSVPVVFGCPNTPTPDARTGTVSAPSTTGLTIAVASVSPDSIARTIFVAWVAIGPRAI